MLYLEYFSNNLKFIESGKDAKGATKKKAGPGVSAVNLIFNFGF